MQLWRSPFQHVRTAAFLAAAVAILLSANSVLNDFAYDDRLIIIESELIQDLSTLPEAAVSPYWPGEFGEALGLWRPVTTGLFGLQWALWGENPAAFHALNVLLHGAVTALVVLLLAELAPLGLAFVAGLLFAVHAVHVEAVANVVGLAEVLSSILYLGACLIFVRRREHLGLLPGVAIAGLFAVAFLTKESAVTLPGVLFLLDGARENSSARGALAYLRRRWAIYSSLVAVAAAVLVGRQWVLGSIADPLAPLGADLLSGAVPRIWTVASTWPHYFRLLFFPLDLSVDYSPAVIPIMLGWSASGILGAVLVLATLGLALRLWGRTEMGPDAHVGRVFSFGVLWVVITLSPVSNVLFLSGVLLAERTFYLPSVGFVAALAWMGLELYKERRHVAVGALVVVLSLMSLKTFTRNATWRNNVSVFDALLREHPEAGRAQWLLGDVQFPIDRSASFRAYGIAISLLDGSYPLLMEVGRGLQISGRTETAKTLFERAWSDSPDLGPAPQALAVIYHREGDFGAAIEAASAASAAYGGSEPVSNHLWAHSLAAEGRWAESVTARLLTIESGEGHQWQQWLWLGQAYANSGDTIGGLAALDSARVRTQQPTSIRQIDSIRATLTDSENATGSQNP